MILVAGGTGNIGRALVEALRSEGHDLRVLTRDAAKAAALLGSDVALVPGDLTQPETLGPALAGADKAFFLAHAGPELGRTAERFGQAAAAAGVRHIVAISSGTISIEPPTTIGRWHLELEEALKRTGVAWTMLRPGNFATNTLRWAPMIRAKSQVFAPHGDRRTSPIDTRDIATVAAVALTRPGHEGKTYTLTGPEFMTPREQVEAIGRAIGRPVQLVDMPEDRARAGMVGSGMPELMADAILELTRAGDSELTSTVREVTGREAGTFEAWARDNVEAFR